MTPREVTELAERKIISKYGVLSAESKGRAYAEAGCDIRTAFQRDRDRIIHSKSFRRLMHKTQVFTAPMGDHFRTRLTHTLEVAQIARTIARGLRINEDLTEAIALGHDLGHAPFGHDGEAVLNDLCGFKHNEQSVRLVQRLERLNLTAEVLDGILNHPLKCMPSTLEGQTVRLSDKIAYINHDIDDALRAGALHIGDLPKDVTDLLGDSSYKRINFLVRNAIYTSLGDDKVRLEPHVFSAMLKLCDFMSETVYSVETRTHLGMARRILSRLFEYYRGNMDKLPDEFQRLLCEGETEDRCVCDYIACMTDRFAFRAYEEMANELPIDFRL